VSAPPRLAERKIIRPWLLFSRSLWTLVQRSCLACTNLSSSGFSHPALRGAQHLPRERRGAGVSLASSGLGSYRAWLVWALLLFLLALVPRVPGLRAFLTSDEPDGIYWASSQFVQGLISGDLSLTYWHFYPGVTMSWIETLGLVGSWALARLSGGTTETLAQFVRRPILDLILAARLPYALLTAGGVAGFYLLARRLLGHRPALLGSLFIAFDPFYLAHSRVAHGDAPVTVFMGLSALAFFVYLHGTCPESTNEATRAEEQQQSRPRGGDGRAGRWWLILSAVMGALAALTKAPGQFMVLFVILVAAGDWLLRSWRAGRPNWRLAGRWLLDLALWGGVLALLFVVLWPAMWVNPVGTLVRMIDETLGKVEEGHLVFFMGQPTLNPGPWFYPYVISFRLTPVTLIGALLSMALIVLRLASLAGKGDRLPSRYAVAILLWFYLLSLLLFGNLSPKKQDRYLLPLLPFLDLLAAFAYMEISKTASQQVSKSANQQTLALPTGGLWLRAGASVSKWADKRHVTLAPNASAGIRSTQHLHRTQVQVYATRIALPLLFLLIHSFPVISAYPYYLAYFNPLLGGLPRAVETTLVGWGEGMEQAAAYLNQRPDADRLYVASVPAQTFLPYFKGEGENFYTNDVALRADYVILYVSQVQRLAPSPEIVRYFLAMSPEHTVTIGGVPYARIYPGPKLIATDVSAGATLANVGFGDQLRLAGYQVSNLKSQISNLQSQISNLGITLYWHALAPMSADYTVSVRVVGPDGAWLAQQDSWPAGGLLPTSQWRQGDYVRDEHLLALPPNPAPGEYAVQVVVYDAATGSALNEPVTVATFTIEETSS
jgi:hypothetical protein